MTDSTELVRTLVALPGPPGEERAVREWLAAALMQRGIPSHADAKGNLLVRIAGSEGGARRPAVVVTAHLDEIALMVSRVEPDGRIRAAPTGGVYTWKWGEGPVDILTPGGTVPAILSYGSIHTNAEESVVEFARKNPLNWERAFLFTGLDGEQLARAGVRPGLRVTLAGSRRQVAEIGDYVCSYFLDDRADVAVWLMALEELTGSGFRCGCDLIFAATASEEVGGDGAQYLFSRTPTDIGIALEIGPRTPESDFDIDSQPTLWVRDAYAAMEAVDGEILAGCCSRLGQSPHWQYLSRGGSDASCAAARGLIARPVTLGLPVENSHGFEIMHREAPTELTRLLLEYLHAVCC